MLPRLFAVTRPAVLALAALLLAACASDVSPPSPQPSPPGGEGAGASDSSRLTPSPLVGEDGGEGATPTFQSPHAAPEFTPTEGSDLELAGIEGWLNSEPLTLAGLREGGRVVLVDFWTYTCVNCVRTLPYLEAWHERYAEHGLTVLGVHTPEFEFERSRENVAAAIARYGLEYPIAQDNEFETWDAFENRFWPAKYLLTPDGTLVFQHFGEGQYTETELAIRTALQAAGHDLEGVEPVGMPEPEVDAAATAVTRELYGGYVRNYAPGGNYAGQDEYYLGPDEVREYEDDGGFANNRWYLQGAWRNEAEAIVHARTTEDFEDYIVLRVAGRSANVVLAPRGDEPFEVVVELNDRPLTEEEAGVDIEFDAEGRSILVVDEPRMYGVLELPYYGNNVLRLRANSDDFAVYAFTFGVYLEGA